MKIYDKYKEIVNSKIGKLEKAYFTTFNLDVDFVESYILPPLLDKSQINNDSNMRLKKEDLNTNDDLKKIKFFYDASMLTLNYKQTLVSMYPVKQENGVFHPKVIYLEGAKATYLIIGSGNLTVNGWGRNIEAFEIINITKYENLTNQVLNFFDDIFEKSGNERVRKTLRTVNYTNKINFIYSFTKDKVEFLNHLKIKKSLTIYSPYFSDLDVLFKKSEFKEVEIIKVVPNLIENIKIGVTEPKEKKIRDKIEFYRFEKNEFNKQNTDSTNHSKIWISDSRYAIGSYNCTESALYGTNFEASIVKEHNYIDNCEWITKIDYKLEFKSDSEEYLEEELEGKERFTRVFELVANYTNSQLFLNEVVVSKGKIEKVNNPKNISLLLPSFGDIKKTSEEFNALSISESLRVINSLVGDKLFSIYDTKNQLIFKGIIKEVGVTDENRFVSGANSLEELFTQTDPKKPTTSKKLENRTIKSNINDVYKKKKHKVEYNYFEMFTYFKNLNIEFEKIEKISKKNEEKKRELKLEKFCKKSICSLDKVMRLLEKEKNEPTLFLYLSICEFNLLAHKVKKLYKKIDFKMDNIDSELLLSDSDKKFISEIMK